MKKIVVWSVLAVFLFPLFARAGHLVRTQATPPGRFEFIQIDQHTGKPRGQWMTASVPGDVITDLVRAGKLKHPYHDFNARDALWVNQSDWLYRTQFTPPPLTAGERLWIVFYGIDYRSRGTLNGREVFNHEGMFSRVTLDATPLLRRDAPNELAVRLIGMGNLPDVGHYDTNEQLEQYVRRHYLKTQMSYGWDFAPMLIGAGIWDRVEMFKTGPVMLGDVSVTTKNSGAVALELAFDAAFAAGAEVKVTIAPHNFGDRKPVLVQTFPVNLGKGPSRKIYSLQVPDPQLWWSWDLGDPNLYSVAVELEAGGKTSDRVTETFAFREVEWEQNPGAPEGYKWVLRLNGRRVFQRGANWVPPESLFGQLTDERYEKLIGLARAANINTFRIWGGGNRERDYFYDLTDQNGIMLWQEFPLACIFTPSFTHDEKFLALVEAEAREIIRAVMDHPSVILYSGGNEFDPKRNAPVISRMRQTVAATDPSRRFIAVSPAEGDSHNWDVWHGYGNLLDYFVDDRALMSEFGLQAWPARSTLEKYLSPSLLWPVNEVHVYHDLGVPKMNKYTAVVPHEDTLDGTIEASQLMQAYYYQRAIEHWRIRKYRVSGTFFWQFNEPWPAICWSVVDYELMPKRAYAAVKESYQPLQAMLDLPVRGWKPGDELAVELFLVNDWHKEFKGLNLEVVSPGAMGPAGAARRVLGSFKAEAAPDSTSRVAALKVILPPDAPATLEIFVSDGDQVIAHNFYDLSIYDAKPRKR